VVCVIRGYFDNSGDEEDPQHKVLTVGGFLASEDQWAQFEGKWRSNLDVFGLAYLHMKKFAHFLGPFHVFKGERPTEFSCQCATRCCIREATPLQEPTVNLSQSIPS
jgi:hypothetical protein